MPELQINYLAVLAAARVTVFIGAIWYSPLMFHIAWVKAHGYPEEKIAEMRKTAGKAFLVALPCYIVMALVLAVFALYTDSTTAMQGVSLGFLVWIGFFATLGLTAHMFSEKPLSTCLLDAGYQLVYIVTMGAIVAVWR